MRRLLQALVVVGALLPSTANALSPEVRSEVFRVLGNPAGNQAATRDTVWFGGDDGSGVAFEGGIWDWDTLVADPLQGWIPLDESLNPAVYFYRVTSGDFTAHGDPCVPVATGGILWCGVHEDEANCRGFVAGMGYQNDMCQWARSPVLEVVQPPQATQLEIQFSYFNDSEEGYDFTHVYLRCYTAAQLHEVLLDSFTGIIGAPGAPATYARLVPYAELPPGTAEVQLEVRMTSDGGWSDQDGYYDSACGPFGLDDVSVTMGSVLQIWDFDGGAQGWTFDRCPGAGTYMGVLPETVWGPWLAAIGLPDCPLGGNAWDFVDEVSSPYWPPGIPGETSQMAISGPVPRGQYSPALWDTVVVQLSQYMNGGMAMVFRPGYMVYPYTRPGCPTPGWSDRRGQAVWWTAGGPSCARTLYNLTTLPEQPLTAQWDSLKFVYEVYVTFGANTQGAPLLDDVRVGLVGHSGSAVEEGPRSTAAGAARITDIRPNPLRNETTIDLDLPAAWSGSVSIHDLAGRRVRTLATGSLAAGERPLAWDGRDDAGRPVEAGVFWVRLSEDGAGTVCSRLLIVR